MCRYIHACMCWRVLLCTLSPMGFELYRPVCAKPGIMASAYSTLSQSAGQLVGSCGRGGEPQGRAEDRVLWISSLTGNRQKKINPFTEEWLAPLSGRLRLRSLSDKDATDGLTADNCIKQAQESEWNRALSLLTKPNEILMMISKWFPRGAAGTSLSVLSRQAVVHVWNTGGWKKASVLADKNTTYQIV